MDIWKKLSHDETDFWTKRFSIFFVGCDFVSKINTQRENGLQLPICDVDVHSIGIFPRFKLKPSCWQQCTTKLSRNFVVSPVVNVENGILIGKKIRGNIRWWCHGDWHWREVHALIVWFNDERTILKFCPENDEKNHNIRTGPERSHFDVNFFLYFTSFNFWGHRRRFDLTTSVEKVRTKPYFHNRISTK